MASPSLTKRYEPVFTRHAVVKDRFGLISTRTASYATIFKPAYALHRSTG